MEEKMYIDELHIPCKRFDGISIQKVVVVEILKGNGTEEDPRRISRIFFDEDGKQLFELDIVGR